MPEAELAPTSSDTITEDDIIAIATEAMVEHESLRPPYSEAPFAEEVISRDRPPVDTSNEPVPVAPLQRAPTRTAERAAQAHAPVATARSSEGGEGASAGQSDAEPTSVTRAVPAEQLAAAPTATGQTTARQTVPEQMIAGQAPEPLTLTQRAPEPLTARQLSAKQAILRQMSAEQANGVHGTEERPGGQEPREEPLGGELPSAMQLAAERAEQTMAERAEQTMAEQAEQTMAEQAEQTMAEQAEQTMAEQAEQTSEAQAPATPSDEVAAASGMSAPGASTEEMGDDLAAEDQLHPALEYYRDALLALDDTKTVDRSRLFAKLGDIERRLGQQEVALYHYTEALSLDPLNLSALFWATEVLYDRQEYPRVESLLQRRLDALSEPGARVEVLRAMVALWLDDHRDLVRARRFLDQILIEQPEDQLALESLIEVQEAQGDHEEAIRTRWWLASLCAEDRARHASLLIEAARAAHRYLGDAAYAVDLGEQALSADPTAYEALELIASLLVETEDWEHLARTYRAMLEVHCDDWVALDLCEKLAILYRDKLGELTRAAEALERALVLDPSNARIRLLVADAYARLGNRTGALIHCRMVISEQPEDAAGYHTAQRVFAQLGEPDGAWLAASALEYLGRAEPEQTLLAETHRPEGLLPVKSVLADEDWEGGLLWPEHDPALQKLLRLVSEVAVEHRLSLLGREQKLLNLDPALAQDPNTSTTMLARSMVWVSKLLGMAVPALYVYPTVPGELGATPARQSTVLASRSLGTGFSLPELAFLWARQLSSLRREHYLLLFYPTVGELAELVTAAFVARDFTPRRADFFDANVAQLAESIRRHLDEAGFEELGRAIDEVGMSEAGARMVRWARGVELVSARVGLLATGEISVAGELTRRFPVGSQTSPEEQRRDLLAFSLSEEYAELRRRLGVAVESS